MTTTETGAAAKLGQAKLGLVRNLPLSAIFPARLNNLLYRPVDVEDPDIIALARSIKKRGVLQELIVTQDRVIVSGHRRFAACHLAGLDEVPCRFWDGYSDDPQFLELLREHNRQREKTRAERLREEIVSADPEEAYRQVVAHRKASARVDAEFIHVPQRNRRTPISKAKGPFLRAIIRVIYGRRDFWPLSDRQIHYALLNDPPLTHASKPESTYRNQPNYYKQLTELLTRARLEGHIPMTVIADETRPVTCWDVHGETTTFCRQEMDGFLKDYCRDLQQSQPNHIEILGEKNTVQNIIWPVAEEYRIPFTIGRGYCSLPPRYAISQRFEKSGKENLILLVLSDHDPDGEEIFQSAVGSLRDDFGIRSIKTLKVALTREQVNRFGLPPSMKAKEKSTHYGKFTREYGDDVYELEALPPTSLQTLLREAIDSVLDIPAFNNEVDAEKADVASLDAMRRSMKDDFMFIVKALEDDTHGK